MLPAPTALALLALAAGDADLARLGLREAMATGRAAFLARVTATEERAGSEGDERTLHLHASVASE